MANGSLWREELCMIQVQSFLLTPALANERQKENSKHNFPQNYYYTFNTVVI